MTKTYIVKSLLFLVTVALFGVIGSCKKTDASSGDCETNQSTKVTFSNTGKGTLRVEVAKTFNSKYEPVDAVLEFDLPAGTSAVKEFRNGRYFIQWKANCPACTQQTFYAKTFDVCMEYTETQ